MPPAGRWCWLPRRTPACTSTTTTALGWWLHPALAAGGAASCVGAAGLLVASLRLVKPAQQLLRPEPLPGQHLTHYPVHLRTGDLRHLFPPNPAASPARTLLPAGTSLCDAANPPNSGSRIRPAPRRPSPSRTPFQCATQNRPRMPESPKACLRERWTGSSGAHCRPGSASRFRRQTAHSSSPGLPFRVARTLWALNW